MTNANGPMFAELLRESPKEVKAPKNLVDGTYTFIVKMPRYDKSTNKGTEFVEFPMQPVMAHEDVDQAALQEALDGGALNDKELRITFWGTDKSIYRLDEFHEHCGVDLATDNADRQQRNENIVGSQVLGYVKNEPSGKDDGRFYANIVKTAPVD